MKTYSTKSTDLRPQWHVIDASGRTLGRLATEVATLLRGKHKPIFTPNLNTGDFVVVVNAARVRVTGSKAAQKVYHRHSNYPGGLKSVSYSRMMETHPSRVIEHAVRGMMPHNRLGRAMMGRLKVYAGDTHPHHAQLIEAGMEVAAAEAPKKKAAARKGQRAKVARPEPVKKEKAEKPEGGVAAAQAVETAVEQPADEPPAAQADGAGQGADEADKTEEGA